MATRKPRPPRYLSTGPIVQAFLEAAMVQTKGEWLGQPLTVEPWQADFLREAFLIDPKTGHRVYSTVVLGLPAKSGKSTIASGIGIYGLMADNVNGIPEGSPEVYAVANSKDQARFVFGQARDSVKASPALSSRLDVQRNLIYSPSNGGMFRALASDSDKVHGVNPSLIVVDELGSAADDRMLVTMQKSTTARRQALTLVISHTGVERYGPLGRMYDNALANPKLQAYGAKKGEPLLMIVKDREAGVLFYWYGLQDGYDPEDPETWAKCNPASWNTVDVLRQQHAKLAISSPVEFIRYHLNAWVAANDEFLPPGAFVACGDEEMTIPRGVPVYMAIDGARKGDSGALSVCAPVRRPDGEIDYRLSTYIIEPDTSTNSMNERLEALVRKLSRRWHVAEVHYDPHMFVRSADILASEGFEMAEFPQTDSRMCPATKLFRELVMTNHLTHDGERKLVEHVGHATTKETDRGERVDKRKARHKIDGCVASIMAVYAAQGAIANGSWGDDRSIQIFGIG